MPGNFRGSLCLGGGETIARFTDSVQLSDAGGAISFVPDLNSVPNPTGPVAISAGETWNFQCLHRDILGSGSFTGAIGVRFE